MAADPAASVGEVDGTPIESGATIDVPAGSVKNLVLPGGARVALLGGASVVVAGQQWYPSEPEKGTKSVRGSRVFVKSGEVIANVPEGGPTPSALSVMGSTGQSLLIWRGTTRVSAQQGDMTVAVDDGAAYVGGEDKWVRMNARSAAFIAKKTAPQISKSRLAPPEALGCAEGGIGLAFDANKAPVNICWKPVSGATGYRIELASNEAMTKVLDIVGIASASADKGELKLTPGTYYARVVAIGSDHMPSPGSATRSVVVTRASLAGGAVVMNDGAILMSRDSSVSVETAGLKVATAGAYDATAADLAAGAMTPTAMKAHPFSLNGQRARVVRLRDASGTELRLKLVLRELHAQIAMAPKNARWPETPLDISATLEDPSKRVDLSSEPVTFEVTVDGKTVPTTWTRAGETFKTRLSPLDAPGPFLIRVSAKDRNGVEIGGHIVDLDGRRSLDQASRERRIAERQ